MTEKRVETIIRDYGHVVVPGVFDALSAKLCQRAGFPLTVISGFSVSATLLGEPDLGLLTQTEMVERARQIIRNVRIPVLVDADTGYGNALNVARTVRELIEIGAAGCFLEDQVWPKRCGHLAGKQVVSREEFLARIRAAVEVRGTSDFFIIARTDSLQVLGMDEAVTRMKLAREVGADASFVEAPASLDELAEIARRVPKPLVANMIEGGKTPLLSKQRLVELGYQLIMYPLSGLLAATSAIERIFQRIYWDGTTRGDEAIMMSFEQINDLLETKEKVRWAAGIETGDKAEE